MRMRRLRMFSLPLGALAFAVTSLSVPAGAQIVSVAKTPSPTIRPWSLPATVACCGSSLRRPFSQIRSCAVKPGRADAVSCTRSDYPAGMIVWADRRSGRWAACDHVWTPALASAMVSDRTRAGWLQDARTWLSW